MGQIKVIILDFDGVIAESNAVKDAAFGEFFDRYPQYSAAMRDYHQRHHAKPRRFKFTYFIEELMGRPGNVAAIDSMADAFSALVAEQVIACPEVPGASVLLSTFSKRLPLYISSVTPQEELDRILAARRCAPYIDQAFGNPPHPKEEAITKILDREGLQPAEAVLVGDSESDYQVAKKTGVVFIGRDSGQPFSAPGLDLCKDLFAVADRLHPLL